MRPTILALLLATSCAPVTQPVHDGMTPTQAEEIAARAVRTAEAQPKLDLQPFDTLPTRPGYTVYLQQRTSSSTAKHWKVRVRTDGTAEVIPADPDPTAPRHMESEPKPLQGNQKTLTP